MRANVEEKPAGTQQVLFGARYEITPTFQGARVLPNGEPSSRVRFAIKGPASQYTVETDFLDDATHTPARIRIPLALGEITLELIR
jgi:hypothetical protein